MCGAFTFRKGDRLKKERPTCSIHRKGKKLAKVADPKSSCGSVAAPPTLRGDKIAERLAEAPVEGSCPVDIDQGHRYDDPKPLAVTQGMLRQPIAANSSHADDRQPTPRQQLTP